MAFSVDSETKIATLDGQEYYPKAVHNGSQTELVALTEDECLELKQFRDSVPSQKLEFLRKMRNMKLAETDWTRMDDNGLTDSAKADWATYRQSLRDITNTYSSTEEDGFTWPTKP